MDLRTWRVHRTMDFGLDLDFCLVFSLGSDLILLAGRQFFSSFLLSAGQIFLISVFSSSLLLTLSSFLGSFCSSFLISFFSSIFGSIFSSQSFSFILSTSPKRILSKADCSSNNSLILFIMRFLTGSCFFWRHIMHVKLNPSASLMLPVKPMHLKSYHSPQSLHYIILDFLLYGFRHIQNTSQLLFCDSICFFGDLCCISSYFFADETIYSFLFCNQFSFLISYQTTFLQESFCIEGFFDSQAFAFDSSLFFNREVRGDEWFFRISMTSRAFSLELLETSFGSIFLDSVSFTDISIGGQLMIICSLIDSYY